MEIIPVQKYGAPRYPTQMTLEQHPELLRIVPKRWANNPVVLTALASACLLVNAGRASAAAKAPAPVSKIAPIFVHGDGVGGYGCVAVAAPLYLTEAEARSIINEEAKRAGIVFKSPGKTLPGIGIPVVKELDTLVDRQDGKLGKVDPNYPSKKGSLETDGTDAKLNVSYEFISNADFDEMAKDAQITCTFVSDDMLGAAAFLQKGLEKAKPRGYHVVFYDPVAWTKDLSLELKATDESKDTKDPMEEARTELRAQVKDFIKWLKGQGVI